MDQGFDEFPGPASTGPDARIDGAPRYTSELRARVRLHALKQALAYARSRQEACRLEAERYARERPDEKWLASSERCAEQEARLIAENIERLMREAGIEVRRGMMGAAGVSPSDTGSGDEQRSEPNLGELYI